MIKLSNDVKLTKKFMRLNWERITMDTVRNVFLNGAQDAPCACRSCTENQVMDNCYGVHRKLDGAISIGCVYFSLDDIAVIKTHLQELDK